VAIVAAIVAVLLLVDTSVQPTPATAGMTSLGSIALSSPTPNLREGEYWYTRSVGTHVRSQEDLVSGSAWSYAVDVVREIWVAWDGSGRLIERSRHARFLTRADEERWRAAGSPALDLSPTKRRFSPGELTSGNPDAARVGFRGTGQIGLLGLIAELLGESPVSGALREDLFVQAATINGLAWDGAVVDPRGRSGVGVSLRAGGSLMLLVFDPNDAALLSLSTSAAGPGTRTALESSSYTFVERGAVGSVKARP
jgi:hypothetical protein